MLITNSSIFNFFYYFLSLLWSLPVLFLIHIYEWWDEYWNCDPVDLLIRSMEYPRAEWEHPTWQYYYDETTLTEHLYPYVYFFTPHPYITVGVTGEPGYDFISRDDLLKPDEDPVVKRKRMLLLVKKRKKRQRAYR